MTKLQDVFNRIQQTKLKQKTIREAYRDELENHNEYQQIKEKIDQLKQRKKEIETSIQQQMGSTFQKFDKYKTDIKMDMEMLADIAIGHIINGQKIEIKDEYDNNYEPLFSVRFKKSNN